jgi:hypothetical protein
MWVVDAGGRLAAWFLRMGFSLVVNNANIK